MRMKTTLEELMAILNYRSGSCMCARYESCSVCSRTSENIKLEKLAKKAAEELLKLKYPFEYNGYRRSQGPAEW